MLEYKTERRTVPYEDIVTMHRQQRSWCWVTLGELLAAGSIPLRMISLTCHTLNC